MQWLNIHHKLAQSFKTAISNSSDDINSAGIQPLSFYRPEALSVDLPTASKHWRQQRVT